MKLEMLLKPDPESGNLVASMPVLPPFPITEIDLKMPASSGVRRDRASAAAPYVGSSTVTPWNQSLTEVFQIQPLALSTGPGGTPARARRRGAGRARADPHRRRREIDDDGDGPGHRRTTASRSPAKRSSSARPTRGQQIGPVIDNEDGTYSAAITSSTAVGTPTITATVTSAEPELSGLGAAAPGPDPPRRRAPPGRAAVGEKNVIPSVRFGKHPPRRTRRHRAVFTFSADVPGSTFFCKLDGHAPTAPAPRRPSCPGLEVGQAPLQRLRGQPVRQHRRAGERAVHGPAAEDRRTG